MCLRSIVFVLLPILALPLAAQERFLLVTDHDANRVLAVNPTSGDRFEISGPNRGSGPALGNLEGVAWDDDYSDKRFLVVSRNFDGDPAVVRIDWATGNRSELSGDSRGGGPDFDRPMQIVIIDDGDKAVVADRDWNATIMVDTDDGDRSFFDVAGAHMNEPRTLARDFGDDILVSYRGDESLGVNARIQHISYATGYVSNWFSLLLPPSDVGTEFGAVGLFLEPSGDVLGVYKEFPAVVRHYYVGPQGYTEVVSAGSNFDGDDFGDGPNFHELIDVVYWEADDSSDDRIYALDEDIPAIIEVDPDDGDRVLISGNGSGQGNGPLFTLPRCIALGRRVPSVGAMDVARWLNGEDNLSSSERDEADINDDGEITITDLVFLVNLGL